MNVLYSGDSAICDGVLLSALSIAQRTNDELNVYIITASLDSDTGLKKAVPLSFCGFLGEVLRKYNGQSRVELFDISERFLSELPSANIKTRFTPFCMLRLYADVIKEIPDKILYLDNDTVCLNNPDELYETEIDSYDLAGVLDYYGSWFFRSNPFKRDYVNSGVLLLNMKRVRENGLFTDCRAMCRDKQMFMPDQSALNKLCKSKLICPRRYNEQKKIFADTVFRHFTTTFRLLPYFHSVTVKPWNIDALHNVLRCYEIDTLLEEWKMLSDEYNKGDLCYDKK